MACGPPRHSLQNVARYMCESGAASGNGRSRSGKWRLSKREMEACLASRRFYMARALTPSHKTTPLSRAYALPYISLNSQWPFPPNLLLKFVRDSFSCPLGLGHHAVAAPLSLTSNSPLLSADDAAAAPPPLRKPVYT
jgi:hypothetical protein